jgi:diguanylate cyclase (GGDEF)-like protein/PAS domain S-box-containing protein
LNLITPAGAGHRPTPDVSIRVPAYWVAAMTGLFLAGAVLPSQTLFSNPQDYLALHITLEFVAMAISGMVFALAWNLRHIEFNSQIVLLGALSLIIVMVDLAHTLSFAGMPALVTPSSVEKSIFFWLTGRLVAAIALLIVAVMPLRHWRVRAWLWLILPVLVVTALVWWVGLYHLDWVPETFIQGKGLTPFKIDTEYAIAAIYALAAILLLRRSRRDGLDMTWLSAAAWVLALAELFFTLYSNVTDLFNLLGHVYKAVAYFMVYRAIFTAGVQEPYRQLGEEKSRLRSLIDSVPDLVSFKDQEGRYIGANRAFTTFSGISEAQLVGRTSDEFGGPRNTEAMHRDAAALGSGVTQRYEQWLPRASGGGAIFDTVETPYFSAAGETLGLIEVSRDVTDQKLAEDRIEHLALFDQLTGLPNRIQLRDKAVDALGSRAGRAVALLFIDLDDFKTTNDTVGHHIGDLILEEAGRRVFLLTSASDTAARLSGDEFALLLGDADAEVAAEVAQKLIASFAEPFRVGEYELSMTASIGIALSPADGADFESLSAGADAAMFRAKQEGHNTYRFVTEGIQAVSVRRLQLLTALRRAIENDELELHYQPQVSLTHGRIVGAEALLRWRHPEFGLLQPGSFIDLAEDSGLILPIGDWVLRRALTEAATWPVNGATPLRVAVNISAVQFLQNDLPQRVTSALRSTGFPAGRLELEITETVAMRNPESAAAMLSRLRNLGIGVAIDDFGTGYSSMGYLKAFRINCIKIDRSFVEDLAIDTGDQAIVQAIIQLAKSSRCTTIAEGVESATQRDFLASSGCDEMQGFLFSRPVPADAFRILLDREARDDRVDSPATDQPVRETT